MKLALLQRTHPEYDARTLRTYGDLFAGGAQFRARIAEYLPPNDVEPPALHKRRCDRAHYLNYCAPIAGYFAGWLFTAPLTVECDQPSAREPYDAWKEDCDGQGTDLDDFLRARFLEALVSRRAYWRVEFQPPSDGQTPADKQEWMDLGMDQARLVPIPADRITNWQRDATGAFAWALEHERRVELRDVTDEALTTVETWTQWKADGTARRWQVEYPDGKRLDPDQHVSEIEPPHNPTGRLPLVELELPTHLWLLDQLADAQLEHFRQRNALSWAIQRTCYAMPVFKLKDRARPPKMGAGYYLMLGVDESIEWPAPPSAPFDTVGTYAATLKDELYRVTHQMAAAVDNNAAAVGRSGESKDADNLATQIVLTSYGAPVREAAEKTYDLVSAGRGEDLAWSARGMDRFQTADAGALTEQALGAEMLKIPSRTHRVELITRVALAMVPDADEATKSAIRAEIAAHAPDPAAATTLEDDADASDADASDAPDAAETVAPPSAADAPAPALADLPVLYQYDYEAGIVTVNEARARKGFGPLAGGDVPVAVYMQRFQPGGTQGPPAAPPAPPR